MVEMVINSTLDMESKSTENSSMATNEIKLYSQPKYIGKCRCFLYIKNNPIIVLGPSSNT